MATLAARLHWTLDLFSHFRWQYVLLAGATIPLAWASGQRALAIACIGVFAIHAYALIEQRFSAAERSAGATKPLRIASINVFYLNDEYGALIDYASKLSPDILCLYETTANWQRGLAPLTSRYAFSLFAGDGPHSGVACLSRIVPIKVAPPTNDAGLAPWMELEMQSGGVRFTLIAAHLAFPVGPRASAARNRQLTILARLMRSHAEPVVLVGDFNLTPYSPFSADFVTQSGLNDCGRGRPLLPTWPTWFAPL
ncbi:MAG TPA: endonuclease/exonuclease/phosphatase family protein, partial [Burkholderiaceae bacterium]|nr:endonuclease/exonuclease/phosphatase family protein [Burkholderiaceae bacterium]